MTQINLDMRDLTLPDGTNPNDLDRFALARTLIALGLDVEPEAPKQESLLAYRRHCDELANAERGIAP